MRRFNLEDRIVATRDITFGDITNSDDLLVFIPKDETVIVTMVDQVYWDGDPLSIRVMCNRGFCFVDPDWFDYPSDANRRSNGDFMD